MPAARDLLIVALFVLALRLPFLNQAIQGDDVYYLAEAQHAQIEPLHPKHVEYAFMGRLVDMRGQPHPPLNAWFLALLMATLKDISEIPFHAAYILFSLIAAFSALALARKFSPHSLAATILFVATPAFVINGNSLESDLPFAAFWLLAIALYIQAVDQRSLRLLVASSIAMGLAALAAYQAVFLVPILFLYGRKWRAAAFATLTAPVVLAAWQVFERLGTGAFPATVVAGYMQSYALQALAQKLKSATALTGHLGWIVFPSLWLPPLTAIPVAIGAAFYDPSPLFWGSVAVGAGILIWCARNCRDFLAQWVLIFFAGALVVFFAGSARYLLPIALPIAILATRRASLRWIQAAIVCELALSLSLAIVNYQHWDGYRQFARMLAPDAKTKRVWINGEWALRYYLEAEGGLPLLQGQTLRPGEMVVSSSLGYPIPLMAGGGALAPLAERTITSAIPLRLVALHGKSAYSTTMFGLRPFDVSHRVIDQLRAEVVVEHKPVLSNLRMNAPEAGQQIVSGVYQLENGEWRWMGKTAVILLKPPAAPSPLVVRFFIPDSAPARQVRLAVNDRVVVSQDFPAPGTFTVASTPLKPEGDSVTVTISVDKTFSSQSDRRELGIILTEAGFQSP
ncbi:MAG TPA: glycosyltransferase family 39 protein [Bryobacteraceae bacterium]|nr:glycosyltransferase family 39 protein [Bryobacteraceae bacterium]